MPLPKSRAFWIVAAAASSLTSVYAVDRYRLGEVRERFKDEARRLGQQPSGGESLRKVTVVSFGEDSQELRRIRQLWRAYAVDLFTLAGCDYQLLEVNAQSLDKEFDKSLPVAEGEVPAADRLIPRVVTAGNWLVPTMALWMQRLNSGIATACKLEDWRSSADPTRVTLYKLWEISRPEPRSRIFFDEGIVSLTNSTFSALKDGTATMGTGPSVIPKLGYIPCDPSPRWYHSLVRVPAVQ